MNYCLVLGIDASGKTSFLNALPKRPGLKVLEPAQTETAQEFRRKTFKLNITPELIESRRKMFLSLNVADEGLVKSLLKDGFKVATSGGELVTNISHEIMLSYTLNQDQNIESTTKEWLANSEIIKPDLIVFLYADDAVIKKRNDDRANLDLYEAPIGFNNPEFLSLYQKSWFKVLEIVAREAGIRILSYDTGKLRPSEIADLFSREVRSGES
jgi:thymidylate kinase